jgi:hypothetical protein
MRDELDAWSQINSNVRKTIHSRPMNAEKQNLMLNEDFMDPMERQRAQTYYLQLQREVEDSICKFCKKQVT